MVLSFPTFTAGMVLSISLIMAIGPQNAHVLRMGLQRQHLWLTVAVCAVADIALIGLGVLGLAQLGGLSDKLHGALVGAGMLFLAVYGWQAFQRFLRPQALALNLPSAGEISASSSPTSGSQPQPVSVSRRQAVLSAMAFSWLNPHAWLDTAVLIGTASLAYGQGSTVFGLGAAAGSMLWFLLLGTAAFWLGRRLHSLHIWRALDGAVALMMWGTALWLGFSLV
ncbi:MAG: LysE family transporter [Limnohabitans sp.]|nr:LysE family transporter [Limnohabitans sp.]MDP4771020.1 LysE family transporter [Limnohabitans sp.]MDP4923301.1 LysE family transporter [Limnohabitans sp.]